LVNSSFLITDSDTIYFGNKRIKRNKFRVFNATLNCWTSSEGNWIERDDPPLYKFQFNSTVEQTLVTHVYSECGEYQNRTGLNYWWEPPSHHPVCSNIKHSKINRISFKNICKVMNGRTLITMGDSLTLHLYETLLNFFGNRTVLGRKSDSHPTDHYTQDYDFCTKNGWSDRNFSVTHMHWNKLSYSNNHLKDIKEIHDRSPAGIIVLANWGAHYEVDKVVSEQIINLMNWFKINANNTFFIFRASSMAHANCYRYKVTDNNMHTISDGYGKPSWHWASVPGQSKLWRDYLHSHVGSGIYMDIFNLVGYYYK
jgi:hypothetical protein